MLIRTSRRSRRESALLPHDGGSTPKALKQPVQDGRIVLVVSYELGTRIIVDSTCHARVCPLLEGCARDRLATARVVVCKRRAVGDTSVHDETGTAAGSRRASPPRFLLRQHGVTSFR